MKLSLTSANAIIVARAFNPSIATKDWLMAKVIDEEPINFVNTPAVSVFETPRFQLIVDAQRFQLIVREFDHSVYEVCSDIMQRYVRLLPETPYTAVGFNACWVIDAESEEISTSVLNSLFRKETSIFEDILGKDYLPGGLVFATYNEARFRLAIEQDRDAASVIRLSYNYHHPVRSSAAIPDIASTFEEKLDHSRRVSEGILEGSHAYSN